MPLITVIVPVYNIREYLPRCVRSITGQTYENLEILLVDDGSTDGTGELCDTLLFRPQDSRGRGRFTDIRQPSPLLVDLIPAHLRRPQIEFPDTLHKQFIHMGLNIVVAVHKPHVFPPGFFQRQVSGRGGEPGRAEGKKTFLSAGSMRTFIFLCGCCRIWGGF